MKKSTMRYFIAIIICLVIFVLYNIIGSVAFGWKHGGGAIPQMILLAIILLTFKVITKNSHQ